MLQPFRAGRQVALGKLWNKVFLASLVGALEMACSLRSDQWSCSELAKGATICADMAGMDLVVNPETLTKDELLQSIKDSKPDQYELSSNYILRYLKALRQVGNKDSS